ncbi:MAG TPA: hypothetical protein VFR34_03960 [Paracoccaceae bacterium]|nr:hypothetical protein [Paracoccaceae bacterium]
MRMALLALGLAACATTEDPAEGGFISGVRNLSEGTYERRIEEREAEVEEAGSETAALEAERSEVAAETARIEAEIRAAEGELAAAKREVLRLRYSLREEGREVPPELEAKVVEATTAEPEGPDPAARLEAIRKAIAGIRAISDELANLSS